MEKEEVYPKGSQKNKSLLIFSAVTALFFGIMGYEFIREGDSNELQNPVERKMPLISTIKGNSSSKRERIDIALLNEQNRHFSKKIASLKKEAHQNSKRLQTLQLSLLSAQRAKENEEIEKLKMNLEEDKKILTELQSDYQLVQNKIIEKENQLFEMESEIDSLKELVHAQQNQKIETHSVFKQQLELVKRDANEAEELLKTKIHELESALTAAKIEMQDHDLHLAKLQEELHSAEIFALDKELEAYDQKDLVKSLSSKQDNEIKNLAFMIESEQFVRSHLEREINYLETELALDLSKIKNMDENLSITLEENQQKSGEIEELKNTIGLLSHEREELKSLMNEKNESLLALEENISSLTSKFENLNKALEKKADQLLADLNNELQNRHQLEESLKNYEDELESKESLLQFTAANLENLENKLEASNLAILQKESEIENLKEIALSNHLSNVLLVDQKNELIQSLEEKQEVLTQALDENSKELLASLENERAEKFILGESLNSYKALLNQKEQSLEQTLTNLDELKNKLEMGIETFTLALSEKQEEVENFQLAILEKEKEIETFKELASSKETLIEQKNQFITSLEEKYDSLKVKHEMLNESFSDNVNELLVSLENEKEEKFKLEESLKTSLALLAEKEGLLESMALNLRGMENKLDVEIKNEMESLQLALLEKEQEIENFKELATSKEFLVEQKNQLLVSLEEKYDSLKEKYEALNESLTHNTNELLVSLENEKEERVKLEKSLQSSLALLAEKEASLESMALNLRGLEDKLDVEIKNEMESLQLALLEKEQEIQNFKELASSKESLIEQKNHLLVSLEEKYNSLKEKHEILNESLTDNRNALLVSLENEKEEKMKLEESLKTSLALLAEKEASLESLALHLRGMEDKLNVEIKNEMESLQLALLEKEEAIESFKELASSKEFLVEQKNQLIGALEAKYLSLKEKHESLNESLNDNANQLLTSLENEKQEKFKLEENLKIYEALLEEKEASLEIAKNNLNNLENNLVEKFKNEDEIKNEMGSLQLAFLEKEEEIENFRELAYSKEFLIDQKNQLISSLEEKYHALHDQHEALNETLNDKANQLLASLENEKEEKSKLEESLKNYEALLAEKEASLESRATDLMVLENRLIDRDQLFLSLENERAHKMRLEEDLNQMQELAQSYEEKTKNLNQLLMDHENKLANMKEEQKATLSLNEQLNNELELYQNGLDKALILGDVEKKAADLLEEKLQQLSTLLEEKNLELAQTKEAFKHYTEMNQQLGQEVQTKAQELTQTLFNKKEIEEKLTEKEITLSTLIDAMKARENELFEILELHEKTKAENQKLAEENERIRQELDKDKAFLSYDMLLNNFNQKLTNSQELKKLVGKVHTIMEGDTLRAISLRYYGSPNHWKEIYEANVDLLKDQNKIPVGTKLLIP